MRRLFWRYFLALTVNCLLWPASGLGPLWAKPVHKQFKTRASWYGPGLQGHRTAAGTRFNKHAMTAASKTLPLGTKLSVKNLRTGKKCKVVVTDHGPYVPGRGLDLSQRAARKIGLKGVAPVKCKVVGKARHLKAGGVKKATAAGGKKGKIADNDGLSR